MGRPPEPSRLIRDIHARHPKLGDYPYQPPPCRPTTAPCMPPSLARWAACPPSSSPASALPTVPPSPALVSLPWVSSGLTSLSRTSFPSLWLVSLPFTGSSFP